MSANLCSGCFVFFFLSLSLCNWNLTLPEISIHKVFTLAEPCDVLLVDFFFLLEIYYFNMIFFLQKHVAEITL